MNLLIENTKYTQINYIIDELFGTFDWDLIGAMLTTPIKEYADNVKFYILLMYAYIYKNTSHDMIIKECKEVLSEFAPNMSSERADMILYTYMLEGNTERWKEWIHYSYEPNIILNHAKIMYANDLMKDSDDINKLSKQINSSGHFIGNGDLPNLLTKIDQLENKRRIVDDIVTITHDSITKLFYEWQTLHDLRFSNRFMFNNLDFAADEYKKVELQHKFIECIRHDYDISVNNISSVSPSIEIDSYFDHENMYRTWFVHIKFKDHTGEYTNSLFRFYDPIIINE